MQRVLKGKSDAYKQLICIMQRVYFQIRVIVFSSQDKDLFRYVWYWGKKQIERVKRGVHCYRQRYASSQRSKFIADSLGCASWVHNILTTVMTRIVIDKSAHHA